MHLNEIIASQINLARLGGKWKTGCNILRLLQELK